MYPKLTLDYSGQVPVITGRWEVTFNGEVLEWYDIKIEFPEGYPLILPNVYETSGKIERHIDMHVDSVDGKACLFVSHQRWEIWPMGSSFSKFLEIPVHNFYLGQAHFAAYGYWPDRKERAHKEAGIVEYYYEKFNLADPDASYWLLVEASRKKSPIGRLCPCGKGNLLRNCHGETVNLLRQHQLEYYLDEAVSVFQKLKNGIPLT